MKLAVFSLMNVSLVFMLSFETGGKLGVFFDHVDLKDTEGVNFTYQQFIRNWLLLGINTL